MDQCAMRIIERSPITGPDDDRESHQHAGPKLATYSTGSSTAIDVQNGQPGFCCLSVLRLYTGGRRAGKRAGRARTPRCAVTLTSLAGLVLSRRRPTGLITAVPVRLNAGLAFGLIRGIAFGSTLLDA